MQMWKPLQGRYKMVALGQQRCKEKPVLTYIYLLDQY